MTFSYFNSLPRRPARQCQSLAGGHAPRYYRDKCSTVVSKIGQIIEAFAKLKSFRLVRRSICEGGSLSEGGPVPRSQMPYGIWRRRIKYGKARCRMALGKGGLQNVLAKKQI